MAPANNLKEEASVTVIEAKNSLTIKDLPPEMLLHIFNFLSYDDLINIASVSDTWNDLVKDLVEKLEKIIKLKLHPKSLGLKPSGKEHRYPQFMDSEFKEVLNQRGKFLEKIDITEGEVGKRCYIKDLFSNDSKYCKNAPSELPNYCPNLQSIKCCISGLRAMKKRNIYPKNLYLNISNSVSELIITERPGENNNIGYELNNLLGDYFSRNKNLQSFEISGL